jgi:hypothetical protein
MRIMVRLMLIWAALDVVVAYFWYRFMDKVNPVPKPRSLEQDIQDFEQWQRSHASSKVLTSGE